MANRERLDSGSHTRTLCEYVVHCVCVCAARNRRNRVPARPGNEEFCAVAASRASRARTLCCTGGRGFVEQRTACLMNDLERCQETSSHAGSFCLLRRAARPRFIHAVGPTGRFASSSRWHLVWRAFARRLRAGRPWTDACTYAHSLEQLLLTNLLHSHTFAHTYAHAYIRMPSTNDAYTVRGA